MQEKSWLNGDTSIAVLDLLDHDKKYRVLSKVLAYKDEGVQFTLHDYNCEDYATSVRYFSSIAESLRAR
jgi:hypothetical protein